MAPRLGWRIGPGRTITWGLVLYTLGASCVPLVGSAGAKAAGRAIAYISNEAGKALLNNERVTR